MSIIADTHFYLLVSLLVAIALVAKISWRSIKNGIDQSISDIADSIYKCDAERDKLETEHCALQTRLSGVADHVSDILRNSERTVESIQKSMEAEIDEVAVNIDRKYSATIDKITVDVHDIMYHQMIINIMQNVLDKMALDNSDHVRINDLAIERFV